jgi:selenocysteine-specific elongation factor
MEELVAQRRLETQGEVVKRAGTTVTLDDEEANAKRQIEAAFAAAGLTVPTAKEVLSGLRLEVKRAEKILQMLLREKVLIRVTPELIFHREPLAKLKAAIAAHKKSKGDRMSVAAFKEVTGISRKYAVPLLEYLDRERVTRRVGDERVIL